MRYLVEFHLSDGDLQSGGGPFVEEWDGICDFGKAAAVELFFVGAVGTWSGIHDDCLGNYAQPIKTTVEELDGDERLVREFKIRETWIGEAS